jgi:thymidylate synthase (FAD)
MDVQTLRSTERPERLVCQCARGDYYDDYVGDTAYAELMEDVDYDESNVEAVTSQIELLSEYSSIDEIENPQARKNVEIEAQTHSFIEKQLSRGHYGPWEHPQITFAVKGVSRVTMAQITRHRHMTFDVQSQRYVDFSDVESIVPKSLEEETLAREVGITDVESQDELRELYKMYTKDAVEFYQRMVRNGVPKEDARFVLPLGTPVNMTFSGNARTFMHVFNLRQKASSQWEIRELADLLAEELESWMPYSFNWYERNKPHKIGP